MLCRRRTRTTIMRLILKSRNGTLKGMPMYNSWYSLPSRLNSNAFFQEVRDRSIRAAMFGVLIGAQTEWIGTQQQLVGTLIHTLLQMQFTMAHLTEFNAFQPMLKFALTFGIYLVKQRPRTWPTMRLSK